MAAALGPILFVVVVVGGLGSLAGAFLAFAADRARADVRGLHQPFGRRCAGRLRVAPPTSGALFDLWNVTVAQIAPIIPYLLLVLILIFRPTGLMGTREH